MACRLDGAKPLSQPMLEYCQSDPQEQTSMKFQSEFKHFQENVLQNVVCEMASILSRPQSVKRLNLFGTLGKKLLLHPNIKLENIPLDPLRWHHNERDSVSNHQPHDCLLNRLFRRRSKKTSKLRVAGLCVGNSPGTGEFPAQMASYAENFSIWWRHHATTG